MPLRVLTRNHQALYNPLPLADFTPTSPSVTYLESGASSTLAAAAGWAFTRSTVGYGINAAGDTLTSFAIDTPRVTDKGLLIEAAKQNVNLWSIAFATAGTDWGNINSGTGLVPVVTSNNATAPDGTLTADTVVFNRGAGTSGDYSLVAKSYALTGTYAVSVWARAAMPFSLCVLGPDAVYRVVAITSTWTRITNVAAVVGTCYIQIGLNQSAAGCAVSGTVELWNSQIELTAASSDIVTTTVAVTRGADVATLTLTGIRYSDVVANGVTTSAAATSPFNLGASSAGAWVGNYVTRLVLR